MITAFLVLCVLVYVHDLTGWLYVLGIVAILADLVVRGSQTRYFSFRAIENYVAGKDASGNDRNQRQPRPINPRTVN